MSSGGIYDHPVDRKHTVDNEEAERQPGELDTDAPRKKRLSAAESEANGEDRTNDARELHCAPASASASACLW
jgi:hypothetical protein